MQINHPSDIGKALNYVNNKRRLRKAEPLVLAVVLNTLVHVPEASETCRYAAAKLQASATPEWVSSYDFSTVMVVLNALLVYTPACISGELLAEVIKRLVAHEQAAGGPYYSREGIIDSVVNAHIALFIRRIAGDLPAVTVVLRHMRHSPKCFQSDFAPAVGRYYIGKALGRPALLRPRGEQSADGSWPAEIFQLQPTPIRSRLITTALAIESLTARPHLDTTNPQKNQAYTHRRVFIQALAEAHRAPAALRDALVKVIKHVRAADANQEIALLPYFFASALLQPPPEHIWQAYDLLGTANINCWVAYTIYDDIIDEAANTNLTPVANLAHRTSVTLLTKAVGTSEFSAYVQATYTAMDNANAWELEHCRLPVADGKVQVKTIPAYSKRLRLADRSFAHALGPMAILSMLCIDIDGPDWRAIEKGFRHYLTARQLNDDLHDWEEDITQGSCSYVVARLLAGIPPAIEPQPLHQLLPAMRSLFHEQVCSDVAGKILRHIHFSRQAFTASKLLSSDNAILRLLTAIEKSARLSIRQESNRKALLRVFTA